MNVIRSFDDLKSLNNNEILKAIDTICLELDESSVEVYLLPFCEQIGRNQLTIEVIRRFRFSNKYNSLSSYSRLRVLNSFAIGFTAMIGGDGASSLIDEHKEIGSIFVEELAGFMDFCTPDDHKERYTKQLFECFNLVLPISKLFNHSISSQSLQADIIIYICTYFSLTDESAHWVTSCLTKIATNCLSNFATLYYQSDPEIDNNKTKSSVINGCNKVDMQQRHHDLTTRITINQEHDDSPSTRSATSRISILPAVNHMMNKLFPYILKKLRECIRQGSFKICKNMKGEDYYEKTAGIVEKPRYSYNNVIMNSSPNTTTTRATSEIQLPSESDHKKKIQIWISCITLTILNFIPSYTWSMYGDLVSDTLPLMYPLVDDLDERRCCAGLEGLSLVVFHATPTVLSWNKAVLIDVLLRALGTSYTSVIDLIVPLLMNIITAMDPDCKSKESLAIIERLIRDATYATETLKKRVFASHFKHMIQWLGIQNARFIRKFLPVLVSWSVSFDIELSLEGLHCLHALMLSYKSRVGFHQRSYLSAICRAYTTHSNEDGQLSNKVFEILTLLIEIDSTWTRRTLSEVGSQCPAIESLIRRLETI